MQIEIEFSIMSEVKNHRQKIFEIVIIIKFHTNIFFLLLFYF